MAQRNPSDETLPPLDDRQSAAFADCVDRLNSGEALNGAAIRRLYPEFAELLIPRLRDFEALGEPDSGHETPRAFGSYRIVRELGRGGMGVVYEAVEETLDRSVALKVLPGGLTVHQKTVARFRREARIVGKLDHPNIVAVYGTGVEKDTPYIAMELVRGETLEKLLESHRPKPEEDSRSWATREVTKMARAFKPGTKPGLEPRTKAGEEIYPEPSFAASPDSLDLSHAIRMAQAFADVAEGLQHAHSKGVIHRDLKPSNLILDSLGRLRILDFGIARLDGQEGLTLSGEVMGTPRYMSPEQASGRSEIDGRTDVYSLGATLYEVLTLSPAFLARTAQETIQRILRTDPRPLRSLNARIPRDLETIVLKCLAKDPAARYGTAEALAQDLRRFSRGDAIEARPERLVERILRRARRDKVKLAVGAALLSLALLSFFVSRRLERVEEERRLESYPQQVDEAVALLQTSGLLFRSTSDFVWSSEGYDISSLTSGAGGEGNELTMRAVQTLLRASEAVPGKPEAYYHLARAYRLMGDDAKAREVIGKAVRLGFVPALVLDAQLEAPAAGSSGGGEPNWKEKAEAVASSAWFKGWVAARLAEESHRWSDAARAYEDLIVSDRKDNETYLGASMDIRLGAGFAYFRAGDLSHAKAAFQSASGKAPEADLLVGLVEMAQDNPDAASEQFEKAWRRRPSDGIAYLIGILYAMRYQRYEEGVEWAQRMSPGYFRNIMLSMCLPSLRRSEEAIEIGQKLVAEQPGYALSHLMLSQAYWLASRLPEASRSAEHALELAPKSGALKAFLANLRREEGNSLESLKLLEEAVELEPAAVAPNFYLGLTYFQFGRLAEAAASIQKAIQLAGPARTGRYSGPTFHLALGQVHELQGLQAEAEKAFDKAIELAEAQDVEEAHWASVLVGALEKRGLFGKAVEILERTIDNAAMPLQAGAGLLKLLERERAAALPDLPTFRTVDIALAAAKREAIVSSGSSWRFFRGKSDPSDGLLWTMPGFDDSAWESGPAGFGYADNDDATVLSDMRGSYSTVYARCEFSIADPAAIRELLLSVEADDGFVAYLNGEEISRSRVSGETTLTHASLALEVAPEPLEPVETSFRPHLQLQKGKNVLALIGLNAQLDSSDFSLKAQLFAELLSNPVGQRKTCDALRAFVRQGGGDFQANARLEHLEGCVLVEEGNRREAVAHLRAASRQAPNRPEPALRLAVELLALDQPKEAVEVLARTIQISTSPAAALWRLWAQASLGPLGLGAEQALQSFPCSGSIDAAGKKPPNCALWQARDLRWALEESSRHRPLRINCGGRSLADAEGRAWSRDRFFSGGNLYWNGQRAFRGEVKGTADPAPYRSERYFAGSAAELEAAYEIPLPRGHYAVKLHFAEIYHTERGKRLFDVLLEGQPVLESYEPAGVGFSTADVKSFEVDVSDGHLTIGFRRRVGSPKLSAIEIVAR